MSKPVKYQPVLFWTLAVISLAAAYAASMAYFTRGSLIFPLDDVYISLVYARNCLSGAPFRFNLPDGPSTGATSILYTCLLVPLAALFKGDAALGGAIFALNAILLLAACRVTYGLAKQCMPPVLAHSCVFGILLNGPVTWGYFCGLDTGLMITLSLVYWTVWLRSMSGKPEEGWLSLGVASLLLALCRPEGAFLVLTGGLLGLVMQREVSLKKGVLFAGIGAGAFLISLLPAVLLTGSPISSSGWAKTAFSSPVVSRIGAIESSAKYAVDVLKGVWMGAYPSEAAVGTMGFGPAGNEVIFYYFPGALVLFLLGALPVEGCRIIGISGLVWWLGLWGLVSLFLPVGWHHHRYLIPSFPIFIIISFVGIARIGEVVPDRLKRLLPSFLVSAWLVFGAAGLFRFVLAYGHGSEAYGSQHRAMADYLNEKAGEGTVAAVDVGILKYFTGRNILDLKGLTAPWLGPSAARGTGSIYDALKNLDASNRPRFAALHSERPDSDIGPLVRSGILVARTSLSDARGRITFVLYDFDWPQHSWTPRFRSWKAADEVDTGNADSEEGHSYRIWMQSRESVPYSTVQVREDSEARRVLGDGGWVTNGGECFEVKATSGTPLLVFMRTFAPRSSKVRVFLNGEEKEAVPIARDETRFQTILVLQDDGQSVIGENRIEIRCAWPEFGEFSSFHYWVFQKER